MRVAVTGSTGTVGRAFVERAGSAGHELVLLGRTKPAYMPDNSEWHQFDLNDQTDDLTHALSGADCAVHLAANIDINPADDTAAGALWATNVLGTGRLIDTLAKARVPHMVMASSANIYDPNVERAHEDTAIRPQSRTLYLSSKAAQEAYARELCRKHSIDCAVMRISSVIGTGGDLVSNFIHMTMAGKTITLANPEYGSDFVALDDVASGLLIAAEKRLFGDFNLSSGQRYTLEEVVGEVAKAVCLSVNVNESSPQGIMDKGFPAIDCARLALHGYEPTALSKVIMDLKAELSLNGADT